MKTLAPWFVAISLALVAGCGAPDGMRMAFRPRVAVGIAPVPAGTPTWRPTGYVMLGGLERVDAGR